jgi:F420-dependent oxidoreductase-like protein
MELHIFTEPQQGALQEDLVEVARLAEELGFAGFFRSDHVLAISDDGGTRGPGPTESWVSLGHLAGVTSKIRLGTLMTSATFRHPGMLAIAVAQVDQMSAGRVDFGFGAGWYEAEHLAYGIPFPAVKERMDRFEEQLAMITGMWAVPEGQTFDFHGDYYSLQGNPVLPRPLQRPFPPILIGGQGPRRTPELAARYASEFNCAFVPIEAVAAQFERVRAACTRSDRDPDGMRFSIALTVCCGETEERFRARAAAIGRKPSELRQDQLGGLPRDLVERLGRFRELGCSRAYLQVLDLGDLDHLRLLAAEVLPAVA